MRNKINGSIIESKRTLKSFVNILHATTESTAKEVAKMLGTIVHEKLNTDKLTKSEIDNILYLLKDSQNFITTYDTFYTKEIASYIVRIGEWINQSIKVNRNLGS